MGKELEEFVKHVSPDILELNPELVNDLDAQDLPEGVSKYRNQPTDVDGIRFDSKKEARRYAILAQMAEVGTITNLQRQVAYELLPAFETREGERVRAVHYLADFVYEKDGMLMIEDVKSDITRKQPLFVIKWKMLRYKYRYSPNMRFILT